MQNGGDANQPDEGGDVQRLVEEHDARPALPSHQFPRREPCEKCGGDVFTNARGTCVGCRRARVAS
jgi:hypothetical protein